MDKLFGSQIRTDTLVAINRLGSTYVSELARILERRPIEVQRALESLEKSGVVQTRRIGTIRTAEMNRQFPEFDELANLLLRISERPLYARRWRNLRRRPRAMGKTS